MLLSLLLKADLAEFEGVWHQFGGKVRYQGYIQCVSMYVYTTVSTPDLKNLIKLPPAHMQFEDVGWC